MEFELFRSNDGHREGELNSDIFRVKVETLTYADWLETEYSERRIMDMQDLMWELWDVYRAENGALYVAEKIMTGSHFGEWGMWAEVEKIEEAL